MVESNTKTEDEIMADPDPIGDIFDFLARNDKVTFKSQQSGDCAMTTKEKLKVASDIYAKSKAAFLARFGEFLKSEHLNYFTNLNLSEDVEGYEVSFHLNKLQRYLGKSRRVDVKNRRFQALQRLIKEGAYFSEKEMRVRNPLLYEQLIGQYLTEGEIKTRDNIDTTNITFVNLLMEKIDRDSLKEKRKEQEDAEKDQEEEEEEMDDDDDDDEEGEPLEGVSKSRWGEFDDTIVEPEETIQPKPQKEACIEANEKKLLREEFLQEMYSSFLEGRDSDFDYSEVDDNQEYDNVELRTRDEEENYFDSESPETEKITADKDGDSDDELDVYMDHLSKHHSIAK